MLVIAILWLRPPPYSTARTLMSMVICLLLPAAVTVKVWQPDAFQLGRAAGLRLPASLNSPFLIGGAAPLLPAFLFFPPVRWTSAIAIGLVFAAVVGYPLLRRGLRRVDRSPRDLAGTVAILLLYGYGAAITVNGAFDRVRPAVNAGTVLDRQENHGRGHSYTLTVEWKAPQTIERRIAVPREVFDRARIGDGLGVVIGRGAFRIPWIVGAFPP